MDASIVRAVRPIPAQTFKGRREAGHGRTGRTSGGGSPGDPAPRGISDGCVGSTVDGLQDAFMASPPHRENILRSAYDHVAIGMASADGHLWVTVIFYG